MNLALGRVLALFTLTLNAQTTITADVASLRQAWFRAPYASGGNWSREDVIRALAKAIQF